jgi:hypothetical protein
MARVKKTARLCDDVPAQEDEGAAVERDLSDGDEGNNGSAEGTGSVRVSDVGSQSNTEGNSAGGSQKYSFGLSTVTVSRIQELME